MDPLNRPRREPRTVMRRLWGRPAYLIASLIMVLTAAAGFLPRMIRALLAGQVPPDWIIHVHVAVYWTWLALFTTQTVNAALGRMQMHRKLGKVLISYGVLMFFVGLGVTFNRIFRQIGAGDVDLARRVNLAPLVDMVAFPVLFALAVYYRRKPEVHKRLMIVTATQLMYPAVVRIEFSPLNHMWVFLLLWTAPVLVGMAHDLMTRRVVHPVYVSGMVLLLGLAQRIRWTDSNAWVRLIAWFTSMAHRTT